MAKAEAFGKPRPSAGLSEVVKYYYLAGEQLEMIKRNSIDLRRDLMQCEIMGTFEADSLRIILDVTERKLEIAQDNRHRWYQDTRLWFMAGVVSGIYVTSQTLQLSN